MQWVTGCLAVLSRFISPLGERGLPLYRLLKKSDRFTWTAEAQQELESLKYLLTNAPILVPPLCWRAIWANTRMRTVARCEEEPEVAFLAWSGLLTRDDHTPSPGAPYVKPGLH